MATLRLLLAYYSERLTAFSCVDVFLLGLIDPLNLSNLSPRNMQST